MLAVKKRSLLKWPSRSKGRCKQDCAKQQDNRRAADSAYGPYRVCPGAVCASKFERQLARAERKRREHGDGDGGAERHGEGGADPGPEDPLRYRKDEHEDRPGAGPDADREHHGHDFSPGEGARELPCIDDMITRLSRRVMVVIVTMIVMVMIMGLAVCMVMGMIVGMMLGMTMRELFVGGMRCGHAAPVPE